MRRNPEQFNPRPEAEAPDDLEQVTKGLAISIEAAIKALQSFGTVREWVLKFQAQVTNLSCMRPVIPS